MKGQRKTEMPALPWPPEPHRGQCEEAVTRLMRRRGGHSETSWVFSFLVGVRRSVCGSSPNVWLLLSPETPLNTDLPSFLSHKFLESLDVV